MSGSLLPDKAGRGGEEGPTNLLLRLVLAVYGGLRPSFRIGYPSYSLSPILSEGSVTPGSDGTVKTRRGAVS